MIEEAKKKIADQRIQTFLEAMDQLGYGREEIVALIEAEREKEVQ